MSCARAQGIDIESFLVDPRAEEHGDFREHYPVCRECAAAVADWTSFEAVLAEVSGPASHPAVELLLAYGRAPGTLASAQREELAQHVAACAPCRDALGAATGLDLERLLAAPAAPAQDSAATGGGAWAWLGDRLAGLFALPAPAWAAIAVALLLLALGLPRLLGDETELPPLVAGHEEPAPEEPQQIAETPPVVEEELAPPVPPKPEEIVQAPPPKPEEIVQAPPPAPEAAPAPAPPAPAPPAASSPLIAALGPEPIRFLPRVGLPAGRIVGGTRAAGAAAARPLALTPETVGLSLERQPSLYWFLPEPSAEGVRVDVSDLDAMTTVLSQVVKGPLKAGVHVLRLGAHRVRLVRDHNYQWMLTPIGADAPWSGGIVRQVEPDPALRAALAGAAPAERLRALAAGGVWYDALDLLSRSIAARPNDAQLRRARADLLEQQGLSEAAAWDRASR